MANEKKPRAETMPTVGMPKIEHFNDVCGTLEIYERNGQFSDVELRAEAVDSETGDFRRLTPEELDIDTHVNIETLGRELNVLGESETVMTAGTYCNLQI